MAKIVINIDKCKGCLLCVDVCPQGVIGINQVLNKRGIKVAKVQKGKKCIGCARCALVCPDCCIEVYK